MVSEFTQNYNLPIAQDSDKVNWYDMNDAMRKIDTAMESNKQEAETANGKADSNTTAIQTLYDRVTQQGNEINTNTTDVSNLENTVSLHTTHLNEIDVTNASQTQRITALENSSTSQGGDINQIKSDINEISGIVQTNTQNIANAKTEIQSLQNITDSMQDDISSINTAIGDVDFDSKREYGYAPSSNPDSTYGTISWVEIELYEKRVSPTKKEVVKAKIKKMELTSYSITHDIIRCDSMFNFSPNLIETTLGVLQLLDDSDNVTAAFPAIAGRFGATASNINRIGFQRFGGALSIPVSKAVFIAY